VRGKKYRLALQAFLRACRDIEEHDDPDTELEQFELARLFDWREVAAQSLRLQPLE
jgi:hypothetical protein